MTDVDYPAAHSADTAWFAIDRDGKVAVFSTGEAGAFPTSAYSEDGFAGMEDLPALGGPRRMPPTAVRAGESLHRVRPGSRVAFGGLFFLRSAEPLAAELASGRATLVPTEPGVVAARVKAPDEALLARLHGEGGPCLGCDMVYGELSEDATAAARGLYVFEHTCENWIAGPYVLTAKPTVPLDAAALPAELRDKAVTFDGRFDEAPRIQPMNHWPSEAWGAAWLDQDGRTVRPVPGREDDYASEYDDYAAMAESGDNPGLIVEPPAGATATAPEAASAAPARPPAKPWWKLW